MQSILHAPAPWLELVCLRSLEIELKRHRTPSLAILAQATASMASLLLLEIHGRLLRDLASSTGIHFQGIQQAGRRLQKNGKSTTTISRRLRNIDIAANIVRHVTQVSCDTYFNEIISYVAQFHPVPAPGDEGAATYAATFASRNTMLTQCGKY